MTPQPHAISKSPREGEEEGGMRWGLMNLARLSILGAIVIVPLALVYILTSVGGSPPERSIKAVGDILLTVVFAGAQLLIFLLPGAIVYLLLLSRLPRRWSSRTKRVAAILWSPLTAIALLLDLFPPSGPPDTFFSVSAGSTAVLFGALVRFREPRVTDEFRPPTNAQHPYSQ